eukprot:GHVN01055939.1.p1 GENE.GHVN01055939.1~~GHVN01055939.1.p1  ORF type:complete len:843 (+),score=158.38 GHVN01055939.1:1584-4112(+)
MRLHTTIFVFLFLSCVNARLGAPLDLLLQKEETVWVGPSLKVCGESLCPQIKHERSGSFKPLASPIDGFQPVQGNEYELRVLVKEDRLGHPHRSLVKIISVTESQSGDEPTSPKSSSETPDNGDNDDLSLPKDTTPTDEKPPSDAIIFEGANGSYLRQSVWRLTRLIEQAPVNETNGDSSVETLDQALRAVISARPISASFETGVMFGHDGECTYSKPIIQQVTNQRVGLEDGLLEVTALPVRRLCADWVARPTLEQGGLVSRYFEVIPRFANYTVSVLGDWRTLIFSDSDGQELCEFTAPQPKKRLIGGWEVTSLKSPSMSEAAPIVSETFVGIEFGGVRDNGTGKMDGWTGCNLFYTSFRRRQFSDEEKDDEDDTIVVDLPTQQPGGKGHLISANDKGALTTTTTSTSRPTQHPEQPGIDVASNFTGTVEINQTIFFVMNNPCPEKPHGMEQQQNDTIAAVREISYYKLDLGRTANEGLLSLFDKNGEQILWMRDGYLGDSRTGKGISRLTNSKIEEGGAWMLAYRFNEKLNNLYGDDDFDQVITVQFREMSVGSMNRQLTMAGSVGSRRYNGTLIVKGGDSDLAVTKIVVEEIGGCYDMDKDEGHDGNDKKAISIDPPPVDVSPDSPPLPAQKSGKKEKEEHAIYLTKEYVSPRERAHRRLQSLDKPKKASPATTDEDESHQDRPGKRPQPQHCSNKNDDDTLGQREIDYLSLLLRVSRYRVEKAAASSPHRLVLSDVSGTDLLVFDEWDPNQPLKQSATSTTTKPVKLEATESGDEKVKGDQVSNASEAGSGDEPSDTRETEKGNDNEKKNGDMELSDDNKDDEPPVHIHEVLSVVME